MKTLQLLTPPLAKLDVVSTASKALPQTKPIHPKLAGIYNRHLFSLHAKVAAGSIFDGPVTVLREWDIVRGELRLKLQTSSYIPMTATRLTYVEALRDGLIAAADVPMIPSRFGACLCACVVVVSSDSQVLTMRRAASMSNGGLAALALGEVLEPSDFDGRAQPLHHAGARAVREELGVALTSDQVAQFIRPLYLTRGLECGSWVFVIAVDLRGAGDDFSAERILTQAKSAKDAWEAESRDAIPFTRPSLVAYLQANQGRTCLWAEELVEILAQDVL